jgi:hypothetical protein
MNPEHLAKYAELNLEHAEKVAALLLDIYADNPELYAVVYAKQVLVEEARGLLG